MLEDKIRLILRDILKKEHQNYKKHDIVETENRLNFACCVCGDSSDGMKKRGNIYLDSMKYYCFNGGCSAKGIPVSKFLKSYKKLGELDIVEISKMNKLIKESNNTKIKDRKFLIEDIMDIDLNKISFSKSEIFKYFKLSPIVNTKMQIYLRKRFQRDVTCFAQNKYFKTLFIFNESSDKKSLLSLQIKTFDENSKYITMKWSKLASKIKPEILLEDEYKDRIAIIDKISLTYGLSSLDFSDDITIFEGYLDAKLYRNSVGMCSGNNDFPFLLDNKRYFYDNDKAGKKLALKKLKLKNRVFLWKKFLKDNNLISVSNEIKDLTDLVKYKARTGVKTKKLDEYFSDKLMDMLWI